MVVTTAPLCSPSSPVQCTDIVEPHCAHDIPFMSHSDAGMLAGQSGSGAQSGEVHAWWIESPCAGGMTGILECPKSPATANPTTDADTATGVAASMSNADIAEASKLILKRSLISKI